MHQLNIAEIKKRDYKKKLVKNIKVSLKKKETMQQYGHKQYKNLSEDEKQGLLSIKKILQDKKKC